MFQLLHYMFGRTPEFLNGKLKELVRRWLQFIHELHLHFREISGAGLMGLDIACFGIQNRRKSCHNITSWKWLLVIKRGIQISISLHLVFFLKNEIPLVELADAIDMYLPVHCLGMYEPYVTLPDQLPCPTCFLLSAASSPCAVTPQARCSQRTWAVVYSAGLSSWGCATGRATHLTNYTMSWEEL